MSRSVHTTALRVAAAALLAASSRAAPPSPPNDNQSPPYLSVYRWDVSGLQKGEYDDYARWLNRSAVWPQSHQSKETWEDVEGAEWQLRPWGEWVRSHPGARLTLSVSILPGSWDGSGPARGSRAGVPVSLEEGATGAYNPHFRKLAENLVRHGLADSILRPGWEFNGGWMTWRVTDPKKAEAFAAYWRQIVTTMRAVPGGERLHFCWNPNIGWLAYPADQAWPGEDVVDSIGLDYYDDGYLKDTYPWPDGATGAEIQARRKRVWDHYLNSDFGLLWWRRFAASHHKPLAIPEWGVNMKPDGHGGLDNVDYVEQMHAFITDPANNIFFHCYFDVQAPDGGHQLSPGTAREPTRFPQAAARFQALFGLPPNPSSSTPEQGHRP
jgi:hypothetical protein